MKQVTVLALAIVMQATAPVATAHQKLTLQKLAIVPAIVTIPNVECGNLTAWQNFCYAVFLALLYRFLKYYIKSTANSLITLTR